MHRAKKHGVGLNWAHKCQNGEIYHTHPGLAPHEVGHWSTHVVCESWGTIFISHIPYTDHRSLPPACTGGLNMVHVGPKICKVAENGQKCAQSWWGQIGYMSV